MKPIEDLIPRDLTPEIKKILDNFSKWISQIVNFGSNIVLWDLETVRGEDDILPPILFLRNYLEYADACSILVRQSSIEPCNTILRTLLENFLYIEYLLEANTKERSLGFLVWNTFQNKQLYLKVDGKSDSYKKMRSIYQKDKLYNDQEPTILPDIDKRLRNNEALLKLDLYKTVVKEYYRTKNKLDKNPNWYNLYDGPRNIEKLRKN